MASENGTVPGGAPTNLMALGRRADDPVVVLSRSESVEPDLNRYLRDLERRMGGLEQEMRSLDNDNKDLKQEIRHLVTLVTELRIKQGENAWVERLLAATVGAIIAVAVTWLWRG